VSRTTPTHDITVRLIVVRKSHLARVRLFLQVTPRVQAVSCDEAYLDLTGIARPTDVVRQLREDIHRQTGCTVSAGLASNMLLAKMATGRAKPNGMFVMPDDAAAVMGFLDELEVRTQQVQPVVWAT
jgi:nucleotidyltransferase/DNA polymerase involved in DNA repair